MKLPLNVQYTPAQPRWMSFTDPAWIRFDRADAQVCAYTLKDRTLAAAIAAYQHGNWAGIQFEMPPAGIVYSGADHTGDPLLPNVTILPDLMARHLPGVSGPAEVLGCTMGHWHLADPMGRRTQEIYEYQSWGLMVLDHEDGCPEIWVLGAGDKVAVPSGCHMTLYNLGGSSQPLVTLDYANPANNRANKDLIGTHGPILLGYRTATETVFALNPRYWNSPHHKAGVRTQGVNASAPAPEVRLPLGGNAACGAALSLLLAPQGPWAAAFTQLGFRLRRATSQAVLASPRGPEVSLRACLVEETQPGAAATQFFRGADGAQPG